MRIVFGSRNGERERAGPVAATQRSEGVVMSHSVKKRAVLFGAALGAGASLALALGLGVFAGAGVAASAVAPPQNTSLPTITGTPQEGQTLTGNKGGWSGNPTSYSYFWKRCDKAGGSCSNINSVSGAVSYTLTSADVAHTVRLHVQARNAGGSSAFAVSAATAV